MKHTTHLVVRGAPKITKQKSVENCSLLPLRNNSEERDFQLFRGGAMKPLIKM
jgi:hypothetical protein